MKTPYPIEEYTKQMSLASQAAVKYGDEIQSKLDFFRGWIACVHCNDLLGKDTIDEIPTRDSSVHS